MAKQKPQLDKFAIAAALQEIAALMELKGGTNKFKARAYNAGARSIAAVSADLGDLVAQDRLTTLPGIGNALARSSCTFMLGDDDLAMSDDDPLLALLYNDSLPDHDRRHRITAEARRSRSSTRTTTRRSSRT